MENKFSLKNKTSLVFGMIFILLLIFQLVGVMYYAPKDMRVFKNIGIATEVYEKGSLVAGSPLMNLYGLISRLFGVHPLIFIFTILPIPMLLLYYFGYYCFLRLSCKNADEIMPAMCFVALLNIWGFRCDELVRFSLLSCWYSDEAFMLHGVLIAAGIVLHKLKLPKREEVPEIIAAEAAGTGKACLEENDDYPEEWDMKKHKIINARNLAIAIGALVIILVAVTFILNRKINDLYSATVSLEDAVNSKCSIYEYMDGDGNLCAYIIKGEDGTLTVYGGGDAANAGALSELILKHGSVVAEWYVYGENLEDCGAMKEIAQSDSIIVEKVYVLSRERVY